MYPDQLMYPKPASSGSFKLLYSNTVFDCAVDNNATALLIGR